MITQKQVDQLQPGKHGASLVKEEPTPTSSLGSIYSEEEEHVLGPWQRIRQRFLAPMARVYNSLCKWPERTDVRTRPEGDSA
jgi:hypothetical protein